MSYGIGVNGHVQSARGIPPSVLPPQPHGPSADPSATDAERHRNRESHGSTLVILDKRTLDRECFAQCLLSHGIEMEVRAFASLQEWRAEENLHSPLRGILLNIGGRKMSDLPVLTELRELVAECPGTPVIVMADNDELDQVLLALENGACGYIPTSVVVEVCIEAISLAVAGGTFVPASSVVAMREVINPNTRNVRPSSGMFTQRQAEVARALRRGKANKIIAYELNLRESTVKVHIRNIMKKLKATNRTEVAYKISELLPD